MAGQAPFGFSHVQQPGGFSPAVISAGPQLKTAGGDGKGNDGSQQSVWTEHVNETGRKYYFNTVTKQSSWEKPDDLRTPAELMLTRCPWREYTSDSGKTYYHNVDTKESKWTIPDELRELREKVERGDGGPVEFNYPSSTVVKNEPEGKSALDQAMAATLAAIELPDGVQAAQPALPTAAPKEEVETSSESEEEEKPRDDVPEKKFKDKKQAIEAFKELLREREVPSAVSFEAACKMIQDDYRFNALTRQNERKQAFNAYKIQKAKDEREEQRLKVKKAREDLEQFFLTTPEMHSTLKYFRCEERFGQLDVWKNVPDETRRDLYADAIFTLSKREKDLAKALRKKNMKTFAEVLDSMVDITYKTSWQTAQLALTENPKFVGDPELMAMDKEDALIVFEDHIRRLEQEEQDEREREKKHQRRIQRKVRDNFLLLLDDLHEQGKLTSMSLWIELFPEFSSDERFLAMLGQPGSTPLDLFKFYVEELKSRFHDEKKLIKDIVKSADFEVVADTTFEEFAMVICNDKRSATLDAGNVKLTYNAMIEKAESREKERQKEEARKAKKQEIAFKEMLKKENIEELILWEDARPKVENAEEFAAITLESERLRLFKEYQTALVDLKQKAKKKKKEKTRKKSKSRSRSRSKSLSPISDSDSEFDAKAKSSSKSKKRRSRSKSRSRGRRSDSYSSISSDSDLDRRSKRGKKKRKKKKKDDSDSEGGSRRKKSSKRRRSRSRTPPRKSRKGGRREHDQEDGEISDTSKH